MNDWIDWNGGECPVHLDTEVEVEFRVGARDKLKAWQFFWSHDFGSTDIIRYRIVRPPLDFHTAGHPIKDDGGKVGVKRKKRQKFQAFDNGSGHMTCRHCFRHWNEHDIDRGDLCPQTEPEQSARADERQEAGAVAETIADREKTHGSFVNVSRTACRLRQTLVDEFAASGKRALWPDQLEALQMICSKLARVVNGNADEVDHWHDIAGYAQLVADRLRNQTPETLRKAMQEASEKRFRLAKMFSEYWQKRVLPKED